MWGHRGVDATLKPSHRLLKLLPAPPAATELLPWTHSMKPSPFCSTSQTDDFWQCFSPEKNPTFPITSRLGAEVHSALHSP